MNYMAWTHPTAPPDIFHKWTALSAISGALRRRVYYDYGHFRLYPNQYNVLIGPPGTMKSTAMRLGQSLLSKVPGVKFSVDSITRERLIQDISQANDNGTCPMTAYCSEFSSFFSSSGAEMAVFLTDIYESPTKWSHSSKSGGQNTLNNPCLNLHACTTPETLAKSLPIHVVGLGLTSRTNFIHAQVARERPHRSKRKEQDEDMEKALVTDLQAMSVMSGEMDWDSLETERIYDDWYRDYQRNPQIITDERLRPWYSRKHTHIIKTCMAIAAGRRQGNLMTAQDLNDAFAVTEELESVMSNAFTAFGGSAIASPMFRIQEILLLHQEPVSYNKLLDIMKRDVRRDEFDECLETLTAAGAIKMESKNDVGYYSIPEDMRD